MSTKMPTFDGEKESWAYYKVKMESYLAKKDLAKYLTEREIPRDDLEFDPEVPAEKKQIDLSSGNRKAAGILLDSIDTTTVKGKAAFHLIEKTHDASAGHDGGLFYKEWLALTKRYEKIESEKLEDLQKEFYGKEMSVDQQPSLFLVELERLRRKLKRKGYEIEEAEFVKQILAKLPKGTDGEKMNPYQHLKCAI